MLTLIAAVDNEISYNSDKPLIRQRFVNATSIAKNGK
jgi:hypothetical protein